MRETMTELFAVVDEVFHHLHAGFVDDKEAAEFKR